MINALSVLFSDPKLYDLFGGDENISVTQMWVAEISQGDSKELRFLYARVLTNSYKSDTWRGSQSPKIEIHDDCFVRYYSLTLHTSSEKLKTFVEHLVSGKTLQEASETSGLEVKDKQVTAIGQFVFGEHPIVRPVMHLPTRNYYCHQTTRLSPTNLCSVDSGAISSGGKSGVFCLSGSDNHIFAENACDVMDRDTGLDFSRLDSWRIGDFEFICAPGLDADESPKYSISLDSNHPSLTLFEPLTRESLSLLVIFNNYSDGSVFSSCVANIDKDASFPVEHIFEPGLFKGASCKEYTLEIYALDDKSGSLNLLLKDGWAGIRHVEFGLNVVNPTKVVGEFSWLEKQVPKKDLAKLDSAKQINRANHRSSSRVGSYPDDSWVPLNHSIQKVVKQLFPKKSDARFFLTLTNSNGDSRLELTDWLSKVFTKHQNSKIAWFDPYMEDVGIELLNRFGTHAGDYVIITTEKESGEDDADLPSEQGRVMNLLNKCSDWTNSYGSVRLKVLAVPASKLHDRMVLIRSSDGQAVSGYHLSNSIQRANQNFPLLVTPIPLDVLPSVLEYADQVIQQALYSGGNKEPLAKIIFNSSDINLNMKVIPKGLSNSSSFYEYPYSGCAVAWWLDDESLSGLSGLALKEQMIDKGYLLNGELCPERFNSLPAKFWSEGLYVDNFHSVWDALGCVIANSPAGQDECVFVRDQSLALSSSLKLNLLEHISPFRENALQPEIAKEQIDIGHYVTQGVVDLLVSGGNPFLVFRETRKLSSWSDCYAIKILWSHAPEELVSWLDQLLSESNMDSRCYSLAVQTLNHIFVCDGHGNRHNQQIKSLLASDSNIVVWLGLYAVRDLFNRDDLVLEDLSIMDCFESVEDRNTILCWLVKQANDYNSTVQSPLVEHLMEFLPEQVDDPTLKGLLDVVREHDGLFGSGSCILEFVLVPMLEQEKIRLNQIAFLWLEELISLWNRALKSGDVHVAFARDRAGVFTDELCILIKYLSPSDREKVVGKLNIIFNKLARIIRKPFSIDVNYSLCCNAHCVNLWLYALIVRARLLVPGQASELQRDCEDIKNRINMSHVLDDKLLAYVDEDPSPLDSHTLHGIIQNSSE